MNACPIAVVNISPCPSGISDTDVKPALSEAIFIGIHIKVTPIDAPILLIKFTNAVAIPSDSGLTTV